MSCLGRKWYPLQYFQFHWVMKEQRASDLWKQLTNIRLIWDSYWQDLKENLPVLPHFLIVCCRLFALRQNWSPGLKLSRTHFISSKNQADLSPQGTLLTVFPS